jgi:nucleosome binding factor SPN SPT16 subunit
MGIEFREGSLMIAPKTTAIVKKGQVYNLSVGLSGLTNKEGSDKESKVYALYVGDTVLVNEVSILHILNKLNSKFKLLIYIYINTYENLDINIIISLFNQIKFKDNISVILY